MLSFVYAPVFVRQYSKLDKNLQEEVLEKLEMFKNTSNHKKLRVHKLKGSLKDCYSFSVNYSHRIVFSYSTKSEVNILSVGDHDIYK